MRLRLDGLLYPMNNSSCVGDSISDCSDGSRTSTTEGASEAIEAKAVALMESCPV